jgi:hypothetical protein
LEEKCRTGPDEAEEKKEKELDISEHDIDVDNPEERPGVGYEIFTIGTGD